MVNLGRVPSVFPKFGSHSTISTTLFAILMTGLFYGMTMKITRLTDGGFKLWGRSRWCRFGVFSWRRRGNWSPLLTSITLFLFATESLILKITTEPRKLPFGSSNHDFQPRVALGFFKQTHISLSQPGTDFLCPTNVCSLSGLQEQIVSDHILRAANMQ
jgi:hypothetical protein